MRRVRFLERERQEDAADEDDDSPGPETLPEESSPSGASRKKPLPGLEDVPTTLEGLIVGEEGKSAHQILGMLVEADAKEIDSILGRTVIDDKRFVILVNRALNLARHGIGGPLDIPKPWISQYVLGIVRTLPSVGGKSREQLVAGFQSAAEMLRRKEQEEYDRRNKGNA